MRKEIASPSELPSQVAFRFAGIEGLRGWMAVIVMFHHIVLWNTGLIVLHPGLGALSHLADYSVEVFVIISGFVITHLILSKPEPYGPYIVRRFLRIYPCYIVCLILGIWTTHLYFQTFLAHPWGSMSPPTDRMVMEYQSLHTHFLAHLIAHLTLMHGAISNRVLFESEYMFLSPAWSLSLEWQFYLVAPLVIFSIRQGEKIRTFLALIAVVGWLAYVRGIFGSFVLPSILPGAALFFTIGICSRFIIYRLPRNFRFPLGAITASSLFLTVSRDFFPIYLWGVFLCWMLSRPESSGMLSWPLSLLTRMLDSDIAKYMGNISYPLYLIHVPVLQLVLYLCVVKGHFSLWTTFVTAAVAVPVGSIFLAIVIHTFVEKPVIRYARTLFVDTAVGASA